MDYSRKINIIGDIDEEMYKSFVEALDGMIEIDGENADIYIELSSHGGDAMSAIALYDRIRLHKGCVTVKAIGPIFSAAVLVLAAGDVRVMTKNSWVMLHEDTVSVTKHNRVGEAEILIKNSRLLEDQWNRLLASKTIGKCTVESWRILHDKETYLTAEKCLELGLVTRVV